MTLRVDRIETVNGAVGVSSEALGKAAHQAWCHSNNQMPIINDSFNVSSQTDHGTGDFTYSFSTPFASTYYIPSSYGGNGVDTGTLRIATYEENSSFAADQHRTLWIATSSGSGGAVDQVIAAIKWMGELS
ncbi:MAG: hypothetical protein HWE30_11605 [Methylocystaceae bacterium]|nr:hypothetical protein [Methylocystaceae bacterium]